RPMALGRRSGGTVEELEALAGGHGSIVVAGDERRAPVAQQRVRVGWIGAVAHGIAHDPDRVDGREIREDRLERDEIRVDVREERHGHAAAAFASASVNRLAASARPTTAEAAPNRASAAMSSRSRMPPPVWRATVLPRAPRAVRICSRRTRGGPPNPPSVVRSTTYSAVIPASAAATAASTLS